MNKRGVIITSTLLGLFVLFFGVLGVRAITLGPDPAQPTATELAARTTAANTLERQIEVARADVPPALPGVPGGVGAPSSAAPEYAGDDEYEEYEDDHEDEDEHEDDDHEEGDDDDD